MNFLGYIFKICCHFILVQAQVYEDFPSLEDFRLKLYMHFYVPHACYITNTSHLLDFYS
jgi:hypothetical protein